MVHLRLDKSLVEALDREAGDRSRSAIVTEALAEYLRKRRLVAVIRGAAGSLSPEEPAAWRSADATDAWVRERRKEWDQGTGA
ncbi:ribbon-helix-helix protein, CopG family [Limnochorda pilosa]|uniref:ribbon-helix-helix protein, CopG family n=1 Tax=Limnochorda pilosa TaxID=1555112 RepID=UPI00082FD063|nr:ribbon-helix-helix protein, CopG family [Limnochorda pilosa]